jgi:thiamine pyrophosphokinase
MRKCFLFLGGDGPAGENLVECPGPEDLVLAADSGLDLADRFSVNVDYAVGDFDSIKDRSLLDTLETGHVITYDRDKEYTDTEIAILKARELGCDELVLIGGGGGRADHLFALFSLFEREQAPDRWYASFGSAFCIDGEGSYKLDCGTLVSFFPLGDKVCRPWSCGLKWELEGLSWGRGSFGISNEVKKMHFQIGVHAGRMLMIVPSAELQE